MVSMLGLLSVQHSPLVTELASEAVEMVHIVPGPHHHLEGWDQLAAGSAVSCGTKQPAEGRVQGVQGPTSVLGVVRAGELLHHVGLAGGTGPGAQMAASRFC